jgi:hypothetical protein
MINSQQIDAIYKLYSNVVVTRGDIAYDADGKEVAYDLAAVEAKVAQDEADKVAQQAAKAAAEQSAISKLTALGLTADEIAALRGQ